MTHTSALLADRYRLDYQIAAGGIGEVWQAEDLVLNRPVAVKLLRAEYAEHAETHARFRYEARHAASLTHPAIAQVFDYHEGDGQHQPFLVMELVDGPSLADVLASGPLAPDRVMDIVAQAGAGLDAAHRAGLVHRDIKPANLLLTTDGTVKITDFGIAYAAGAAPITRHGQLIGTPAYLAPERIAGEHAGPASDLYSLGILAHECLTGARPFTGTAAEIAVAHSQRPLPPLPASVPGPVAAFITELTDKDPAARPVSARLASARAAQLRDSLAAPSPTSSDRAASAPTLLRDPHPATLADGEPPWYVAAHGDGGPGRPRSADGGWSRRRVALAIAVASVAAGLIGWFVSTATGAGAPSPAPAASHVGSKSSSPAVRTVMVDSSALSGQPVSDVTNTLLSLGLLPQINWIPPGDQTPSPGTVTSVSPSGQVPVGATVIVTAVQSQDHGHGHGDNGNGNGN